MFAFFHDLITLKLKQRQMDFKTEILEAILALDQADKNLLCRAFDMPVNLEGLDRISNMSRKELACRCAEYYVRTDGKWEVLPTFRTALYNIRKGN